MRRRLDAELVRRGLTPSRTRATEVITAGRVLVGGGVATTPARQVAPDEAITVTDPGATYSSRGGDKLAPALDLFAIDVQGLRVLDAGASTGGFTDCVLSRGAERVYAVDVGRGQLAWRLRSDPRVTVLDRTNVRALDAEQLGGPVPVTVVDLSFISLLTVAPALARCTNESGHLVLLVKPQFEAGRQRIGKGGIVRDPSVHRAVLREVTTGLADAGLPPMAVMESPLTGRHGNREFFVHCRNGRPGPASIGEADIEAVVNGVEPGRT